MVIKDLISKGKILNRLLFFGGIVLFIFFILGLTKEVVNRRQLDSRIRDYEARIEKLKVENEVLDEKIIFWDRSTELEANVRTKLSLEKPGEQTIIIVRDDSENNVAIKNTQGTVNLSREVVIEDKVRNPQKWWQYFFNNNKF